MELYQENVECKPANIRVKKPRRIIHCSNGTLPEYSTDEESECGNIQIADTSSMTWLHYAYHLSGTFGYKTLAWVDYFGSKIAWFLGITSPKYASEMNYYKRLENNEKVYDVFKTPFHAPYENPLSVLPRMSMEITPDSEYPSVATPGYIKPPMTPLNESNILNEKPLWIGFLDWVDRLDVIIGHTFTNTTPKTRKIKIEMFCYKDDVFATPELFGDVLRMNFISRPMVRNLKNLLIGANRYLIKFHSDNSTEDIENILVTIKKFGAGYVRLNLKMSELGYLPTIVMVKENIKNQIFGLSPRNPKLFNNALAQIISMIKKKNVTNQSNVQSAKGIVSESTNQST
ncbi:hypothetical protein A3Q56_00090 [Intoshia linei]|uniref:Mediator complex subunit Med25 PTOV domain-containing protein n=1 Tax=Intoshia linei TaxID=1819745 RepID=A0A177BCX6_9BILA|nr:hypothetical protein A3Q56_00090 [Intoshia linei]